MLGRVGKCFVGKGRTGRFRASIGDRRAVVMQESSRQARLNEPGKVMVAAIGGFRPVV